MGEEVSVGVEGKMPYVLISGPATITLPLPDDVSSSLSMNYTSGNMRNFSDWANGAKVDWESISDTASSSLDNAYFLGEKAIWAVSTLGSAAGKKRAGAILNANKEMLFEGTNFRKFAFTWTILPLTQEDAEGIYEVTRLFQKYSCGSLANEGRRIKYPDSWTIRFHKANLVNNIKDCFIEGVSVNYSTGGNVRVHKDGYAVSTTLTVNFTEVTIRVEKDF